MAVDKTKNSQFLLTVSNDLMERIEDHRFKNRFQSRNEAVRDLIEKGLKRDSV